MSHEMKIVNKGVEQSSAGPLVPTPRMAFIGLWRMRDNHDYESRLRSRVMFFRTFFVRRGAAVSFSF